MRIQHNIPAMNAYRNYNTNVKALQSNLQKLSSGYKINKAGDDAAGLAISEKMRAQITGLEVAQKNAKDGISLVQTAEGAMTEIHTMLNRMFSLAEQSANGTYADEVDREQLNNEFEKLTEEIDRIAQATNFNGKKLLDGTLSGDAADAADGANDPVAATLDGTNAAGLGTVTLAFDAAATDDDKKALNDALIAKPMKIKVDTSVNSSSSTLGNGDEITISDLPTGYTAKIKAADGTTDLNVTDGTAIGTHANQATKAPSSGNLEIQLFDGTGKAVGTVTAALPGAGAAPNNAAGETTITFAAAAAGGADAAGATFEKDAAALGNFGIEDIDISGLNVKDGDKVNVEYDGDGQTLTIKVGADTFTYAPDATATALQGATKQATNANGDTIDVTFAAANTVIGNDKNAAGDDIAAADVGTAKAAAEEKQAGLRLRVGDSTESYDNIYVSIKSLRKDKLVSNDGTTLESLDVLNAENADTAMNALKDMINYVSTERGNLGATQNRLDHTINNLSTMQENIQDAEATIRDVDVAEEMMKYTKNNILVQSAQAMLAQANQLPQGVLQLLG